MSNGWKAFCFIAGVVLFVMQGLSVAVPRIVPGWFGLAFSFLPFAWDAAEAA